MNAAILLGPERARVRADRLRLSDTDARPARADAGLGGGLGGLVVAMILAMPDVPRPLLIGSLFFPVYYTVLSFVAPQPPATGLTMPLSGPDGSAIGCSG